MAITIWMNNVFFVLVFSGFVLIVDCRPTSTQLDEGSTALPPIICDVPMGMDVPPIWCSDTRICVKWRPGPQNVQNIRSIWLYYCSDDCIQPYQREIDICHVTNIAQKPSLSNPGYCSTESRTFMVEWDLQSTKDTKFKTETRIIIRGHLTDDDKCPKSN